MQFINTPLGELNNQKPKIPVKKCHRRNFSLHYNNLLNKKRQSKKQMISFDHYLIFNAVFPIQYPHKRQITFSGNFFKVNEKAKLLDNIII